MNACLRYIFSAVVMFTMASLFYTQQVIAKQISIGAVYTLGQKADAYLENFIGLAPAYGVVLSIGLGIGFLIAYRVKRAAPLLAPIAYPIAGAASVLTVILMIENTVGAGGVGAIGGARDAVGLLLQCLAGSLGGVVFSVTAKRS